VGNTAAKITLDDRIEAGIAGQCRSGGATRAGPIRGASIERSSGYSESPEPCGIAGLLESLNYFTGQRNIWFAPSEAMRN